VFPALFTAGMSLIDTTDGVLTLGAYNWAFIKSDPQALLQIWSSPRYPWWSRY
jgi:high-affinity nickel permease